MRLTKLEIYGFKSFAKRTEILFPQNVTGIVGPNGSGKSNIGDAVRWVLGEQSAKMLRGNSMQDVIFNGTAQRKALNYCEVTLVFDNSDHKLQVSFEEVSITRRVYRSGESEYLMNGAACRLRDIVDLFRDTGVGKEGYSIIGQGRIDEILSQRSEDRRAVFEEAAGISRYRSRKEEAENRLKKADANLVRVYDVLEELQSHLGPLEKQAKVAKEYLALSESLKELDVRLYLLRYDRLSERENAAEQALLQLSDVVRETEKALEEAAATREKLEGEQAVLQDALAAAHDVLLARNEVLFNAKEALTEIRNRLQNHEETASRFDAEGESLQSRLKLIDATLNQNDGGLSESKQYVDDARQDVEAKRAELDSAGAVVQELEEELSRHNAKVMERVNRTQTVRTSQARQSAMQQAMTGRRAEIAAQLTAQEEKSESLKQRVQQAEEQLESENNKLADLKAAAAGLEKNTDALLQNILQSQKQLHEDQQNARALETRLRTLRELQDGYEGYQYSVRNALNYAKKSGMKGVHNVLAMLLNVPKEYEVALDMALGAGLQNIVTETEQEAKSLIDYLRKNKLGRATFLPLSTVKSKSLNGAERAVLNMEGCLGVASDLCSYDEKYRGIMENLLGRTVVARDLECGIQIMRRGGHQFRLVTLDGDLMHAGGSMTGGSIQQKAQNLLGREREIQELTTQLQKLTNGVEAAIKNISAMEAERAGSKERREKAQYDVHQQEIAVVRDTEYLKQARLDAAEHEEMLTELREAIAQLDESLEQIAAELKRLEEDSSSDGESLQDLNAYTEQLSVKLDKARRNREKAQEMLTDAMLTLQNAEHDYDSIQKDRSRLNADRENCLAELQTLDTKRRDTLTAIAADTAARSDAENQIALCEDAVEDAKAGVSGAQAALKDKQDELKEVQAEAEVNRIRSQKETERMHRQEMALNRIKTELSTLNERLWNTYELSYAGAEEAMAAYLERDGLSDEWRDAFDEKAADEAAAGYRDRIRAMGTVNVAAIEEFAQMSERYSQLDAQRNDLEKAKQDLEALIAELLQKMETVFVGHFNELQHYFAETFTRLFGGGCGEIMLSDPNDPLNCGIDIIVQPPGKKRQLLSLFSGGERALTAIAILFAMLKLKPTPFCILDEIEAALDDANISTYADYLKEFSADTQFIIVTHRKGTMERCDTLFGVAMQEKGVSSMVSVNLTDYE